MKTEAEQQAQSAMAGPAATASEEVALTAETGDEPEEGVLSDDEQENPFTGHSLSEEEPENTEWELEEEVPEQMPEQEEENEGTAPPAELPAASPVLPAAADSGADAARQQYWRGVLTGSAETVPDAVRERAGVDKAGLTEEQGEYRLFSTINRSWAVDNLGLSREQVRTGWSGLRRQLAGKFRVADDEQELFAALSAEAQDAPRRERVKALYEEHYHAALLGRELPQPEAEPAADGEEPVPFADELAAEARQRGRAMRQQHLRLASEVAEGLHVFAGLEEDPVAAFRMVYHAPELARSVEALAGLDERSRQIVYAIAQEEFRSRQPSREEGLIRTTMRSARRGATGLGFGVGQALAHTTIATMNSLGNMLGEEMGNSLHGNAKALDLRARIVDEMRHLLYEEVKPLRVSEEAGFAGQLLVDAAGATPAAIVAFCGGAGFATLGFSGMGEAVAAARQRAPEGSQWLQYLAGVVGGGIQASIYSGMSRVGGQVLSNAIGRFARASGTGAGGYTLASLGVLGSLGAEEAKLLFAAKTADAAALGTQELAARLEKTASNIDWQAYGDNALDVELNLREAAMTLPFILIGSGRVALRHFRSRDAVLGDGHALQQWGIDESTRHAIMKEPDINRQGDLLRDALRGSRRWSAPGFVVEAMRALRLLNTDYYQGFKDSQAVVDFLKLPSQNALVPRPPVEPLSPEHPEYARLMQERHGSAEKVNKSRLWLAIQLREEWLQKAHLVGRQDGGGQMLPTPERRRHYGMELLRLDSPVPQFLHPGGAYVPNAEAGRMAMYRDLVAEVHDLSYQMLLASYPLDALSHSTRGLNQLSQAAETGRRSVLEAVGRSVLRRVEGVPEHEALDELGRAVSEYFKRRRYSSFPPGWMSRVDSRYTRRLDEFARSSFSDELAAAPVELRDAYRVVLGMRACSSALYELLPMMPDFRTALARGLPPAKAYVHLLSRELGVPMTQLPWVNEMLTRLGKRVTDMRAYRLQNEEAFRDYSSLTGYEFESGKGEGRELWRARRPNGSYTAWHPRRSDVVNDVVANSAFVFMPFSYDRMAPFRVLDAEKPYDLAAEGKMGGTQFTGYDNLCRVALRDTARSWVESAPFALPGFELGTLRRYVYLGSRNPSTEVLMQEGDTPQSMLVDRYTLSSPLRLAQARFRTFWWRQLNGGLYSVDQVGDELVKLNVMSPKELAEVKDIATPLAMPKRKDVPLRDTPPPDVPGMNRAMADYLTDFSMRYFLAHLDDMPLPPSAREWFRLAPLCPLETGTAPQKPRRFSIANGGEELTCVHNRAAVNEMRKALPAVAELRLAERQGLLINSPLVEGLRRAVGLNRALNLEQAWCAALSGGEAMMSGSPAFWKLMEQPLAGWEVMRIIERESLRRHVESTCRLELSPAAMEAEGRGEKPDYVYEGLQNLQEVLQDYPHLRHYGLEEKEGALFVRQLQVEEMRQGSVSGAEVAYEHAPLYTGGSLRADFRLGSQEGLPEFMQEDSRVLPALHLLARLRSYQASRPFVSREGIQWKGELYGGYWGRPPRGLEGNWVPETPLRDLIAMLRHIEALQAELPEGKQLHPMVEKLPGLRDDEVAFGALRHVTLYRSLRNPSNLCRLMPGEPESANAVARSPYLVQSIAGAYLGNSLALRDPETMYRSYTPLESFRPYRSRIGREGSRRSFNRAATEYTLSGALSSTMRMISQDNPQGGLAGMRELLLRFTEDTGFSCSLRGVDPRHLSFGQIQALNLARELLLCVCGTEPEAAYGRLVRLGHRIRRNSDARDAVRRALVRSAEELYMKGQSLFREVEPRQRKSTWKRVHRLYVKQHVMTEGDKRNLDDWNRWYRESSGQGFNSHTPTQATQSGAAND